MTSLKACPFCGQSRYVCTLAEGDRDTRQYTVVCDAVAGGCGASCGWQDTLVEAKAAWNQRDGQEPKEEQENRRRECTTCSGYKNDCDGCPKRRRMAETGGERR